MSRHAIHGFATHPMTSADLVCLGRIVGAHGIKGEVRIENYCEDPAALADYGPLVNADGSVRFVIRLRKPSGQRQIAAIEGIETRDQAEALAGTQLHVDRSQLPELAEGEHYVADLVGLEAVDPSLRPLGIVTGVHNHGAGDILEIAPTDGAESFLLPFTRDTVPSIDHDAQRIVVDLPDGVL